MCSGPFVVGLVDPGSGRERRRRRRSLDEAFGRRGVGGRKDAGAVGVDRFGASVMDGVGGHEADPGVAVLAVVPGEELATEAAGVLDRVEACGEAGPVFQRLELRLGVGVVGRRVRAVVRLEDAEVGQEERDGLAGHRAAAVGVHRQLMGLDVLLLADLGDQVLGDEGVLAVLAVQPTA